MNRTSLILIAIVAAGASAKPNGAGSFGDSGDAIRIGAHTDQGSIGGPDIIDIILLEPGGNHDDRRGDSNIWLDWNSTFGGDVGGIGHEPLVMFGDDGSGMQIDTRIPMSTVPAPGAGLLLVGGALLVGRRRT